MKILIRIMQGTGFVLIALGMLACDSSIPKGAVLIAAGAIIMYGFARMERDYYFAGKEEQISSIRLKEGRSWDTRG